MDKLDNSPDYYKKLGVELKDVLKIFVSDMEGVQAHYVSNILKYLWRMNVKHDSPLSDIAKAIKYNEFVNSELQKLYQVVLDTRSTQNSKYTKGQKQNG